MSDPLELVPKTELLPLPPDPSKPLYMSKTFWASTLTAVLPLVFPPAAVWVAANPALFSALLGVTFAGLRYVTQDKVTIL